MSGSLRVRAVKMGFYNHQRRYPVGSNHPKAGEVFAIKSAEDFSEKWMQWVDGPPAGVKKKSAELPASLNANLPPPGTSAAAKLQAQADGAIVPQAGPGQAPPPASPEAAASNERGSDQSLI